MRIFRLPILFRLIYPGAIFRYNARAGNIVYLTFDDGPVKGVTEQVLEILVREDIKATFFCSGELTEKNPGLIRMIRNGGFGIANHGYHHIKGWRTKSSEYISNTFKGASITGSRLFRPPFGSITPWQYSRLRKDFRVVFWDLILYDFDQSFDTGRILNLLKRRIRPGSVIVLHDNEKSNSPLILGDIIKTIREMGYVFGELAGEA